MQKDRWTELEFDFEMSPLSDLGRDFSSMHYVPDLPLGCISEQYLRYR